VKVCPKCFTETPDSTRFCPNCGESIPAQEQDERGMIGRTIAGKFLILEQVGEGAMGSIYKAEQTTLGKTVCIKVLHQHLSGDKTLSKRFHREARAASRIKHPNAINIIDFGTAEDGTHYIAMDFIDGRDLAHLVRKEFPFPPERLIHIIDQICSALDDAHAQGIIHRDLKPENIMIEDRRHQKDFVTVLDFGIAKIRESDSTETFQTMAGIVCGTPEYMSPEQARGEVLDARSDIYSLGVILYQLCTAKLPFTADTPIGVVTKHLTQEPPRPRDLNPNLHPALEQLTLRLMSKDREKRPPNCLEVKKLVHEIGKLIERDREAVERTAPMTRPSKEELDRAAEPKSKPAASKTSPYAPPVKPAADAEVEDTLLSEGKSGSGLKIAVASVVVLALLGTGGWFAYKRFFASPATDGPGASQAGESASNPTDGTAAGAGDSLTEEAHPASNQGITEEELRRRIEEAARQEAARAQEDRKKQEEETRKLMARMGAVTASVQDIQLVYAENDRLLALRSSEWKDRKRDDKVQEVQTLLDDCAVGKKRTADLQAKLRQGELLAIEPDIEKEKTLVESFRKKAELVLSEELPAVANQADLAAAKVQRLTQQIDASRKELSALGTSLSSRRKEWENTPDKAKIEEFKTILTKVTELDAEYQSILSRMSPEQVGDLAVEYGKCLGKRDVLLPSAQTLMSEKVGPSLADLKKKEEEEKKRLEEKRRKDEENRKKQEEARKKADEARKLADEAAKKKADEEAKKAQEDAKAEAKAQASANVKKGDDAVAQGNYAAAILFYKEALKGAPSADLHKKLGKAYNSKGDYANGAKHLKTYLKLMEGKLSATEKALIEKQIRE
jgi:serine/threonine-protein kinase